MHIISSFTMSTPDGPFSVIARCNDDHVAVLGSGWTADVLALMPQIHPSLRSDMDSSGHCLHGLDAQGLDDRFSPLREAVVRYYDGDFDAVATIPVVQRSGPFRELAWQVLRKVHPGESVTYGEYARRIGVPSGARAAAGACSHNAAALFVPCHRVVRSDGGLGGFLWGTHIKKSLLRREGAVPQS